MTGVQTCALPIFNKVATNGDINGFRLCKRGPKLTHLFFADDSLLFCRANSTECSKVTDLLSLYEEVSGQKINKGKTALFFSKSVTEANKQIIKGILGVRKIHHYEKYLGYHLYREEEKKQASII